MFREVGSEIYNLIFAFGLSKFISPSPPVAILWPGAWVIVRLFLAACPFHEFQGAP